MIICERDARRLLSLVLMLNVTQRLLMIDQEDETGRVERVILLMVSTNCRIDNAANIYGDTSSLCHYFFTRI